jgi:hypothetical protein
MHPGTRPARSFSRGRHCSRLNHSGSSRACRIARFPTGTRWPVLEPGLRRIPGSTATPRVRGRLRRDPARATRHHRRRAARMRHRRAPRLRAAGRIRIRRPPAIRPQARATSLVVEAEVIRPAAVAEVAVDIQVAAAAATTKQARNSGAHPCRDRALVLRGAVFAAPSPADESARNPSSGPEST